MKEHQEGLQSTLARTREELNTLEKRSETIRVNMRRTLTGQFKEQFGKYVARVDKAEEDLKEQTKRAEDATLTYKGWKDAYDHQDEKLEELKEKLKATGKLAELAFERTHALEAKLEDHELAGTSQVEKRCYGLIMEGFPAKEIAKRMGISVQRVSALKKQLVQKGVSIPCQ